MSIKNKQNFYNVFDKLEKNGLSPTANKGILQAQCPKHGRKTNRCLSVVPLADDEVIVSCSAGCDEEAVVEAIGLKMKNLSPSKTKSKAMLDDGGFPTLSKAVKWAEKNQSRSPAPKFHEVMRHVVYYADPKKRPIAIVVFEALDGLVKIYRIFKRDNAGWHVFGIRNSLTQGVLRQWVEER